MLLPTPGLRGGTDIPAGDVSGVWNYSGSPYMINGDITIQNGQTLVIDPGVSVIFKQHGKFQVKGRLLAVGKSDSIISFTATSYEMGWHGIRFKEVPASNDTSKIIYCKVQWGYAYGDNNEDRSGGGIGIKSADKIIIQHCEITTNRTEGDQYTGGGGIVVTNASPVIVQNLITNNHAIGGHGGGVMITGGSDPIFQNNVIFNNTAFGGGGIGIGLGATTVIVNNTIFKNTADHGGGLDLVDCHATVINTILFENIATDVGMEVHIAVTFDNDFIHCNIPGGIAGFAHDHQPGCPGYIGIFLNNIDEDPLFPMVYGDCHLSESVQTAFHGGGIDGYLVGGRWYGAPSVDFENDPRPMPINSDPDIGADESALVTSIAFPNRPNKAELLQCYPNPAESLVSIPYRIKDPGMVAIHIYNMHGMEVGMLTDDRDAAGEYVLTWDARNSPSGIYTCVMRSGNYAGAQRVVVYR